MTFSFEYKAKLTEVSLEVSYWWKPLGTSEVSSFSFLFLSLWSLLLAAWLYFAWIFLLCGFPDGSVVKNPPAHAGDVGSIPGLGNSLEKETATHSRILAWEIPWTEELGGLQSMGSQRVRHDWVTEHMAHLRHRDDQPEDRRLELYYRSASQNVVSRPVCHLYLGTYLIC